ncbi:hypothetical protein PN498_07895 [Oscillatoria sp. CS-180]|uniref:hypothetical protein n=1 Tax=Oscillatoria sp. CS-180 TaxID=3021720 RepID=UPI00232D08BF|nr:hypothetical protein [Oscillatoria sp. CS-180]MDB9525903.1 hypothetical protein [Oscillatoria sp. CS-180]
MGAMAFLILLGLGILLSFLGWLIGTIDAFRVSTLWGVLALLVPFAVLVYGVKFQNRKWARNSLIMNLLGLGSSLLSLPLLGGRLAQRTAELEQEALDDLMVEEAPLDPEATEDGVAGTPAEGEDEALFQEAMLPGLPTAAEIARAELLPSTDPNERIKEIDRERTDPYAYVPIPPVVQSPPAPEDAPNNAGSPPSPNQAGGQAQPTSPGGTNATAPGGVAGEDGQSPPETSPTESLPVLPPPTVTAAQVEISGVANVDGENYAIVKAPGEPSSRYVKVGDRLSNGTVLVKRIENRPGGPLPVVVLEERGEEIALPVGSNVGSSEETAAAMPISPANIAALPVLP